MYKLKNINFNFMKSSIKNLKSRNVIKKANQEKENLLQFQLTQLKPFSASDLTPVPKGWEICGPKFVGIGAMRAGTSWWYSMLIDHPQIVKNRLKIKELRYFVHFGYRGLNKDNISTYFSAFAAPTGSICGEWSPIYLYYPMSIKYLAEAVPTAKILIILRNPIDRVLSTLNMVNHHNHQFTFNNEQQYVFNVLQIFPMAINSSLYSDNLRRLLTHFNRKQILVLQYEKCKSFPQREMSRTYRFLGVDDQYKPKNIDRYINRKDYLVPKLKPKERLIMAGYYADDVKKTIKMFPEIDLSLWKDFDKKKI